MSAVSTPAEGLDLGAAVEAAAKAEWGNAKTRTPWAELSRAQRAPWLAGARAGIEAAAPILEAQALRDAAEELGQDTIVPNFWHWLQDRAQGIEGRDG